MKSVQEIEKEYQLNRMVEAIDKKFKLDKNVKRAMLSVDRELFVPQMFKHFAYSLDALPMSNEQWISSPLTVAKMTQFLEPKGCDRVLEIGCGSGYQAAILSKLFKRVFTMERIDSLLQEAKERFRELNIKNILAKFEDGNKGWEAFAPYDRIIFSASPEKIPDLLFDQLKDGGILLAPVDEGGGLQIITRYYKKNGNITHETIEPCNFVPVLEGTVEK
jgi:protein-L-isoaspartate(D-aspartate) O-methyltransferase